MGRGLANSNHVEIDVGLLQVHRVEGNRKKISARRRLLSIKGLSVRFGGIVALDNVSFDVKAGQICGLIGSNGAGKTMLLNCLSRLYQAGTGTIHFAGERLLQLPHHCVARLGIGRTFQSLALFRTMSVRDNVVIGGHRRCRGGFVANALRLPIVGREERLLSERAKGLLEMLELTAIADVPLNERQGAARS